MFKKAAIIIALLGVLGSGQTEWLDTGLAAARKISGAVPEDLTELLSSVVRQKQQERRKSISKQAYTGRVSSVSDGDTLHVTDSDGLKHKIRLAYIDAPELQQAYGTRSHQNLKRAADGENVNVTVFELDRYGREVAQVRMDGEDLNLMQIRDGAAWHYNAYAAKKQKKTDYAAYAAAQENARQSRNGLWNGLQPQAPWDYRREQREVQKGQGGGRKKQQDKEWFNLW
nr:thermonuclease family protein [uncultured Neisseria sp.]